MLEHPEERGIDVTLVTAKDYQALDAPEPFPAASGGPGTYMCWTFSATIRHFVASVVCAFALDDIPLPTRISLGEARPRMLQGSGSAMLWGNDMLGANSSVDLVVLCEICGRI